jgi:small nuclear ribonucleoprotein (snRNP)-like protein
VKKLSDSKQMQMNVILRDAENYAIKLENKEKILEKRNLYLKDKRLITV